MANDFIPRKFKNIETNDIVNNFETVVNSSRISVILGEPASGKTYQLENYAYDNGNATLLEPLDVEEKEEHEEEVFLFDSIDEALINYPKIKDYLKRYIKKNQNKKFVITCRYLEWKEKFEKKLKKIDKDLKVYEILPLGDEDINKLLQKSNIKIENFWKFMEKNHLSSLLKNIIVLQKLIENFNSYKAKKINYIDIYQDIIEDNIKLKGTDKEDTKRRVKELLPTASSLATYMTLNRKDIITDKDIDIEGAENFVDELYQINNDNKEEENFKKILNSGLFEKKGNDFTFFHKSVQEYLTAYFINFKKLDSNRIKKIFSHNLRFYEEFEEVIIYLTNMRPELFDDFVDFDPFIFRRHPSLNAKQQKKLLLSILDKLQNAEWYAWDRVDLFYGSSLVKFDKIDVYSLIIENIKDNQSDILLHYIMRVFAENHHIKNNEEFEEFIFEKLKLNPCRKYLSYSYNFNYRYNKKLFIFMQENKLFNKADDSSIEENMFLVLYGCKFDNYYKFDFKNLLYLLKYIKVGKFQKIIRYIDLYDIEIWTNYLLKDFENIEKDGDISNKNIAWMFFLRFSEFDLSIEVLEKIIHFIAKHIIEEVQDRSELNIEKFWKLYFEKKISIYEVFIFLKNYYDMNIYDIHKLVNRYPIEDYFIQVLDLIEMLNLNNKNHLQLWNSKQENFLEIFQNDDTIPIEYIFKLLSYDYWKELEDLVFELLEKFVNDEKCREYIEKSHNKKYEYNIRLFDFMKKYNLFKKPYYGYENEIEKRLFSNLLQTKNNFEIEKQLFLLQYISSDYFSDILEKIEIKYIEKWFNYLYKYDKELLESKNNDYKNSVGNIVCKLLINNNFKNIPLEKIIFFFKKTKIEINNIPWGTTSSVSDDFYTISKEFWNIYFSDKIKNFEEVENFINLYDICEEDIKVAIEQYPIENYIEKYYGLDNGVQYSAYTPYIFVDILIDNKQYRQYIEKKQKERDSLDKSERNYLDKITQIKEDKKYLKNIKNYSNENIFDIFDYALYKENKNVKETDKKLREDLQQNYKTFINSIVKKYSSLEKKYDDNCDFNYLFNYLFNILPTKKAIDNALKREEKNYKKLFWYIILGCISTDNRELFKVIEDKFELFLEVAKELIEVILKQEKKLDTFSNKITSIFCIISFNEKEKPWSDFLEYLEDKKGEEPQYINSFEQIKKPLTKETLLKLIKKNDKDSFYYFEKLSQSDMNMALKYFYEYIYDPIPRRIKYSKELQFYSLSNKMNNLFNRYLIYLNRTVIQPGGHRSADFKVIETEEEKKIYDQQWLEEALFKFYKNIDCSFNVVKIILFYKLLLKLCGVKGDNALSYEKLQKLDKKYIKKILIDYYDFFKGGVTPKNDSKNQQIRYEQVINQSILDIWEYLESDIEHKEFLEELGRNENKLISDSAEYTLLKLVGKDRNYGNDYYKNIIDKGILPITSPSDLFEVTQEIFDKDIRNWIEEKGAYKFINELSQKENNKNAEDLIQKTLEAPIESAFFKRGHKEKSFIIKREEQLLDDKRLDFTISYPPFGSIVIELKLAHNNEVKFKQDDEPRRDAKKYISKLEQYIKGSKSNFGLFVIFNVKDDNTKEKFEEQITNLKELYSKKENISVIGLNCVK